MLTGSYSCLYYWPQSPTHADSVSGLSSSSGGTSRFKLSWHKVPKDTVACGIEGEPGINVHMFQIVKTSRSLLRSQSPHSGKLFKGEMHRPHSVCTQSNTSYNLMSRHKSVFSCPSGSSRNTRPSGRKGDHHQQSFPHFMFFHSFIFMFMHETSPPGAWRSCQVVN